MLACLTVRLCFPACIVYMPCLPCLFSYLASYLLVSLLPSYMLNNVFCAQEAQELRPPSHQEPTFFIVQSLDFIAVSCDKAKLEEAPVQFAERFNQGNHIVNHLTGRLSSFSTGVCQVPSLPYFRHLCLGVDILSLALMLGLETFFVVH